MKKTNRFILLQASKRSFVKVSTERYVLISEAMLAIISQRPQLTIIELIKEVSDQIKNFNGDLPWHILRIKADLESKKLIRCTTGVGPEKNQFIQKRRPGRARGINATVSTPTW